MTDVGLMIKNRREKYGFSLKKLGDACGISDSEVQKIENGTRKKLNWFTLCKIANALQFHPFELLLSAGYISEKDIHPNSKIHGLEKLNDDDIKNVQLFIDFLDARKTAGNVSLKGAMK